MERIGVPPGTEVGGYRVLGPLGRGGTGSVHRAADGGGAEVALKLLHPHLAEDDDARERLRREVAALQRLRHRAIARVLDAEIDSSDAFVVTELVDGPDLAAHVRAEGPLDTPGVLRLAEVMHEALEVVHAAGVLHRDLSPGNVLVSSRGPVLIDFGIAQAVEDPRVTSTGLVVGTPGYLAPELLEGEDPTRATDWWGWAAVLAFAATGRPPFGTRPVQAVLARVRSGEADLVGLDPALAAPLRRALAVRPEHRPPPEQVLQDLRRAVAGAAPEDAATGTAVLGVARTSVLGPDAAMPDADRTAPLRVADPAEVPPGAVAPTTTQSAEDDGYGGDGYSGDEYHGDGYVGDEYHGDGYVGDDYSGDDYGGPYDPAFDDHAIPPAYLVPRPRRRLGTVLVAGAVLAALGATRPGVALAVAVGLAGLARSAGVAVGAVHARRERRGVGRGDVLRAVVASPWYLLRGVVGVVPAALVAASVVVVLGGVTWWALGSGRWVLLSPADGEPSGELAGNAPWVAWAVLAGITALGLVVLWFGPMTRTTRLGARWVLTGVLPGRAGTATFVVLALAAAVVLAALTYAERLDVLWWPLPGAPDLRDVA